MTWDSRDWAETYSAELRSYPCHPSSTMTELFLNLVQKLSGIFFPMQLMYHSMCQKVILWLEKVKPWILAWFLCIWIWFCWIVRQKCLLIFGQTLLILANVCSSWWDIKLTQPKSALKFFRKDFYLLILREIQTDQNLVFIFHDRHIFLALLVK